MNIFEIYASNIKKFRAAKKMSQAELAEKVNLSVKYISDLETGRSPGSLETLVSITGALGIEPYEILMSPSESLSYDSRRTKQLMARLRVNLNELVDTVEGFLKE